MLVVMVSINFSWISHHFDASFVFVGVQIKKVTKNIGPIFFSSTQTCSRPLERYLWTLLWNGIMIFGMKIK